MSDPLIRELDHYVVLEPGRPQELLSAADTLVWLEQQLDLTRQTIQRIVRLAQNLEQQLEQLSSLPADLRELPDGPSRAQRLLDTACELELEPGVVVQWFAIRLEPTGSIS